MKNEAGFAVQKLSSDVDEVIREAAVHAQPAMDHVCEIVDANILERETIQRLGDLTRHGYSTVDIKVRVEGREVWLEGDWLVRLLRGPHTHSLAAAHGCRDQ